MPHRYLRPQFMLAVAMLAVFLLAFVSPVRDSELSDSWGALLVSQAIIEQRSIKLNSYPEAVQALGYRIADYRGYQIYNFPLGTSLAAVPFVAIANGFGLDMAVPADDHALQNLLSALSVAVVLGLGYLICRAFVGPWSALAIALIITLSTVLMPTMGSALWSINLAVICTSAALAILVRPEQNWLRGLLVGVLLVGAYVARPSSVSFIIPALLFVIWRLYDQRRRSDASSRRWHNLISDTPAPATLLTAALGMGLFVAFSLFTLGLTLPPYYQSNRLNDIDPGWMAIAAYGHLFSPSRGLLIFSPHLFVLLAGILLLWQHLRREGVFWLSIGWLALHLLLISSFYHWWGGFSYGNRLFSEAVPALFALTALIGRKAAHLGPQWRRNGVSAFITLACAGVLINTGQGLFNPLALGWNYAGGGRYDVNIMPELLFDWRFPQFLVSEDQLHRRDAALAREFPPPNILFGRQVWPLDILRASESWHPLGVQVGPDMLALLGPGWHDYEPAFRGRWMRADATIWVVTESEQSVQLLLKPLMMNDSGRIGQSGRLRVTVNAAQETNQEVVTGDLFAFPITLNAGTNRIDISYAGGEAHINGDLRLIAVAYDYIELNPITAIQP